MKLAISALMAAVLASAAAGTDAHACGFFNYREVQPVRVKPVPVAANDRIAAADQRLDEEKPELAAAEVVAAFPSIRASPILASPLETRARRILSLAVVRRDGTLAAVNGFSGANDTARRANIAWAIETLRAIDAGRHDDPVAGADLAEALARSPGHEDEAFTILADLADRDLIGSAHAYATLARLLASKGEAAGVTAALERCEHMTRSPSAVCRAPDGRLALRD
jgi:hypothetical protein